MPGKLENEQAVLELVGNMIASYLYMKTSRKEYFLWSEGEKVH